MGWVSPYGHRAEPNLVGVEPLWLCVTCGRPLTFVRRTDRNGWWAHPRRRRARHT